ncbi:MAG TPA: hypothetical protein VGL56_15575 [Fimbriimonadaceae bacterium]
MSVRSVLVKAFSISPVIFIGAVCAQSRFYHDSFQPVFDTAAQESAIAAYVAPVKLTRTKFAESKSPEVTRSVAQAWLSGAADGTLKPLLPSAVDDTLRSPIKGQIYMACDSIVERLLHLGDVERSKGQFVLATQDHVLALRTCEILKYSDSGAVSMFGARQRGLLKEISLDSQSMPAKARGDLRSELVSLKNSQGSMEFVYNNTKSLYERDEQRHDSNDLASLDPDMATEIGFIEDPMTEKAAIRRVTTQKRKTQPSELLRDFDLAYKSQRRFSEQLDEQIKKLPNSKPGISA